MVWFEPVERDAVSPCENVREPPPLLTRAPNGGMGVSPPWLPEASGWLSARSRRFVVHQNAGGSSLENVVEHAVPGGRALLFGDWLLGCGLFATTSYGRGWFAASDGLRFRVERARDVQIRDCTQRAEARCGAERFLWTERNATRTTLSKRVGHRGTLHLRRA